MRDLACAIEQGKRRWSSRFGSELSEEEARRRLINIGESRDPDDVAPRRRRLDRGTCIGISGTENRREGPPKPAPSGAECVSSQILGTRQS
jgi:hypothetical protein